MFLTKRGKIAAYLKTASPSPFHDLLAQWHTGQMQERLEAVFRNAAILPRLVRNIDSPPLFSGYHGFR